MRRVTYGDFCRDFMTLAVSPVSAVASVATRLWVASLRARVNGCADVGKRGDSDRQSGHPGLDQRRRANAIIDAAAYKRHKPLGHEDDGRCHVCGRAV